MSQGGKLNQMRATHAVAFQNLQFRNSEYWLGLGVRIQYAPQYETGEQRKCITQATPKLGNEHRTLRGPDTEGEASEGRESMRANVTEVIKPLPHDPLANLPVG